VESQDNVTGRAEMLKAGALRRGLEYHGRAKILGKRPDCHVVVGVLKRGLECHGESLSIMKRAGDLGEGWNVTERTGVS
jgi:hypothetical protein